MSVTKLLRGDVLKLNRSRYAILGLLSRGPASGYDIRRQIQQGLCHFWNESFGQIYPILGALADERLATRRLQKQKGKPDRQIYSITAKGRRELKEWLIDRSRRETERNETLLKLFFSSELSQEEQVEIVRCYRSEQQEALNELRDQERDGADLHDSETDRLLWTMTISHMRNEARARIRWCDDVTKKLQEKGRRKKRA